MPVGASFSSFSQSLEAPDRHAALEALMPVIALATNVELQPLGERIDDGDADAVKAAGDLVAGSTELAAGVQHGQDHFRRGLPVLVHDSHGDASAVVGHGDGVVRVDGHR